MKAVVFAGGSGTASFASHLVAQKLEVTFLVNAYDDGRSTGAIRRALNILGPSDMAKLVTTLSEQTYPGVAVWLAYRTRVNTTTGSFRDQAKGALNRKGVPIVVVRQLLSYIELFLDTVERCNSDLSLDDLALRNAVLVGAMAAHGGAYQPALDYLALLLDLPARVVVVSEAVRALSSKLIDGRILNNEWEICVPMQRAPVEQVYVRRLGEQSAPILKGPFDAWPQPEPTAAAALRAADVLIWAPGTLYSSLVPTAAIVGDLVNATHSSARRILIANLRQEQEATTVYRTVLSLNRALRNWENAPLRPDEIADTVICDIKQKTEGGFAWGDIIPADHHHLTGLCRRVLYGELESSLGVHDGARVVDQVMAALDD